MQHSISQIAAFREEQALREQAAKQGLSGLAVVANHKAINTRMEQGAERIMHLVRAGKTEEALALMSSDTWCDDEDTDEREREHA